MAETYAVTGPTFVSSDDSSYSDGSDAYANPGNKKGSGNVISFYHLPSATSVYFKAFITNFNETFASDWAQESVYGRADPIYMFKQTRRSINLAFKIPAADIKEAYENLARVQALTQFLYPTYATPDTPTGAASAIEAQTITQSPLVRLKVMNFLRKNQSSQTATNAGNYSTQCGGSNASLGALGVIESVAIDHSLAAIDGVIELGGSTVLSKIIEVNLNFSVIHEHSLGWVDKEFATPTFPYGARVTKADSAGSTAQGAPDDDTATAAVDNDGGGWLNTKRSESLERRTTRVEKRGE